MIYNWNSNVTSLLNLVYTNKQTITVPSSNLVRKAYYQVFLNVTDSSNSIVNFYSYVNFYVDEISFTFNYFNVPASSYTISPPSGSAVTENF